MSDTIWKDPLVPETRVFFLNKRNTARKHVILKRLEELGYTYLSPISKEEIYNSELVRGIIINNPMFSPGYITYTDKEDISGFKIGSIDVILNTDKYRYNNSSIKAKSKTILL